MLTKRYATWSDDQRLALEAARKVLQAANFGGQTLKLYIPCRDRIEERHRRICEALRGGSTPEAVARAERVSKSLVLKMRARFGAKTHP